jgi:hypothetical protein
MAKRSKQNKRLIALFFLGYLLFNYPLMALFNLPEIIWGIPLLYAYLFGVWVLLIVLVILIVGFRTDTN